MTTPEPVFLQHIPAEVARELDRRYGLVLAESGTGHVSVHLNDRTAVSFEHRDVGKRPKSTTARD
jgi:hypothetical protein